MTPNEILNDPFLNKGTAFTEAERKQYHLTGLIPAQIRSLREQTDFTYKQVESKDSNLEKRLFLMEIFNTNRILYYKLFSEHVAEFMPIVYDPTIADSIEHYSSLYMNPENAAFLSIDDPDSMKESLKNAANGRDIQLIVVTDAGILGIGDWGTDGVDMRYKLIIYGAAGVDPSKVLPVVLDVGTNNQKLLDSPVYLGNQHKRVRGDQYFDFVDQFVQTTKGLFPDVYLHWEDFGRSNAAKILNKYKDKMVTFNDDIQGTGIIVLAGILGALQISKQKLADQRYLSFGAGTAGAGITKRIFDEMVEQGLSEDEARSHFYMVDKQGLLFDDDDTLTPEQKPFARKRSEFANADKLTSLAAVVSAIHPTILVGTSTQPDTFTEAIVKDMAAHTERPIIFPLSNPTVLAEAKAEDLIKWTDGKGLIATGIPADDVTYKGVTYQIGQGNNALIYPGLGLGTMAAKATVLNDEMISAAAHSLGGIVDSSKPGAAVLPPVTRLAEFSQTVAQAVAKSAIDQGIARVETKNPVEAVENIKWEPEYQTLRLK